MRRRVEGHIRQPSLEASPDCQLPKLKVVGSTPATPKRSRPPPHTTMTQLTRQLAHRLAQRWCESELLDDFAAGWGIELEPELVGKNDAIIERLLSAFPWLTPSRYEGRWADVFFDGEVASAFGVWELRAMASLRIYSDEDSPFVDVVIYPNVFITHTHCYDAFPLIYDEASTRKNRERLRQSMTALEQALGGPIIDAISDQFEAIDRYGIPDNALSVYASNL